MPSEILSPLDEADLPAPGLQPPDPAVRRDVPLLSDAQATPQERLAYLFRRCPAHPLRQILAEHRGVHE